MAIEQVDRLDLVAGDYLKVSLSVVDMREGLWELNRQICWVIFGRKHLNEGFH